VSPPGHDALHEALDGRVPAGLARALDPADAEHLARVIARARRDQAEALDEAAERALGHVPFPLRGAVRRALGG
jgi:hypothetical protein